ncbi:hypothetical protein EDD11_009240 [Mortierella claussenii]|nr:hypothetical protein EDD11_009240 [Mortierella claussenii]
MGVLVPFCLTSDANHLFGITVTYDYSPDSDVHAARVVLIKSNANPTSSNDVSWSGVFTYIDTNVFTTPQIPVTAGIQYSPLYPATPNGNNTGLGGWKNVDFANPYSWTYKTDSTLLFHMPDPGTQENVLIQAWLGSNDALNFGVLDNASLKFHSGPTWTFNSTYYSAASIDYHNNVLVVLSYNSKPMGTVTLMTIPFTTPDIPASRPVNISGYGPFTNFYQGPNLTEFFLEGTKSTGFFDDTYFLIYTTGNQSTYMSTFNMKDYTHYTDATTSRLSADIPLGGDATAFYWKAIGGQNGSPAFGFSEIVNYDNSSRIMGLPLNGANVGQWYNATYNINVTDSYGISPTPTGYIVFTLRPSLDSRSTSPSVGLIVGLVLAILLMMASFGFLWYRRRSEKVAVAKEQHEVLDADAKHQHHMDHTAVSQPLMTTPGTGYGDPKTLVAPAGVGVGAGAWAAQQQHHAAFVPSTSAAGGPVMTQPGQQQFLFSSHPMPNFVASTSPSAGLHQTASPSNTFATTTVHSPIGSSNSATYGDGGQSPNSNASSTGGAPTVPLHSRPSP